MKWYLLKTWEGKEEELVREIRSSVPPSLYEECFVIYQERIWRRKQRSIVHVENLFPGCVFLTCRERCCFERTEKTDSLFSILPMMEEDVNFLEKISGEDHMVRLSYVWKDDKGEICGLSDPLKACKEQIERYQFKKRYAMVRHRLWGEERGIVLGIILKEDSERKLLYGSMERAAGGKSRNYRMR